MARLAVRGRRAAMIGTCETGALEAAIDARPARAAALGNGMQQDPNCIFCKIARGEIPSRKVYEDEAIVAFHDISPIAPVHLLLIPKVHVPTLYETSAAHEAVLGRMMAIAGRLAREQGATDGFRTIVNTGRVGRQEVMHVHIHVIGGPDPLGPMIVRKGSQGD